MTERTGTKEPPAGFAEVALASSVGRSLFYLVPALDPGKPYTTARINNHLNRLQGAAPGWIVDQAKSDQARQFYDHTLVPLHIASRVSIPSDRLPYPVKAYVASDVRLEHNKAYAGDTLDWEIAHPAFTRTGLLGNIIRLTSAYPRPITMLKAYSAIINSPTGSSDPSTVTAGRLPIKLVDTAMQFYASQGILTKRTKRRPEDRQFELSDPSQYKRVSYLGAASLAIYQAATSLYASGRRTINSRRFFDEALAANPSLDERSLLKTLTQRGQYLPFIGFADQNTYNGKITRYEISQHAQAAIADLITRQELLRTDKKYVKASADRARQIMGDESLVALLMSKARLDILSKPSRRRISEPTPYDANFWTSLMADNNLIKNIREYQSTL